MNLSPRQLAETSLVDLVAGALATSGVDPASVELELTEGALMDDVDRSIERLRELRGLGVRLAVDDFGTGYSSLNYLKRLPLDTLKIDRSFVSGLGSEPHDSSIVTAVVALAAALGLQTLAEGVETPEHLAMLRDLGCHLAQGYYFSRPVAADAVTALLEASPHW